MIYKPKLKPYYLKTTGLILFSLIFFFSCREDRTLSSLDEILQTEETLQILKLIDDNYVSKADAIQFANRMTQQKYQESTDANGRSLQN